MDASGLGAQIGNVADGLAADSRSLEQLKRAAREDPRQAVKKVATQFEAMFMQMVLKSMREATMRSGMLDSQEQDLYRGMLDQQVAQKVAASGTGLSDLIARQLSRTLPAVAATGTGAAPGVSATVPAVSPPPSAPSASAPSAPGPSGVPPTPIGATAQQRDFMQHWADAVRAQQLTGVPASSPGQAALESGWGSREIRGSDGQPSHNLFGIKAGAGWKGRTVQVKTRNTRRVAAAIGPEPGLRQLYVGQDGPDHRAQPAFEAVMPGPGQVGLARHAAGRLFDRSTYGEKLARVIRTASSSRDWMNLHSSQAVRGRSSTQEQGESRCRAACFRSVPVR
jgi:flagellar protein FlgJ